MRARIVNAIDPNTVVTLTDTLGNVLASNLSFGANVELDIPVMERVVQLDLGSDGSFEYEYTLPGVGIGLYVPIYIATRDFGDVASSDSGIAPLLGAHPILAIYRPDNKVDEANPTLVESSPSVSTSDSNP